MTQAVTLAQLGGADTTLPFRNRIINGDMRIDQRNAGSVTIDGNSAYSVDRWFGEDSTDGTFTLQQSTNAPAGFNYSLKATVGTADTSLTGTQIGIIGQRIEGFNIADLQWGTANAKTITVSFWARSSVIGNLGGAVWNSSGGRSYPFTYTTTQADTWQQFSVTIPGDTTGTWLTDNGRGINLAFALGAGPTYSSTVNTWYAGQVLAPTGAANIMATSGNTLYITGIQFETGTVATPFERRPYGLELTLCQRYCFQPKPVSGVSMFPSVSENGNAGGGFQTSITFPVTMRSQPSLVTSGSIDSTFRLNWVFAGSTTITSLSGTHQGSTHNMTWYGVKTSAFQGAGQVSFNEISSATTYVIYFQAEL
jgi:hypothetical protein